MTRSPVLAFTKKGGRGVEAVRGNNVASVGPSESAQEEKEGGSLRPRGL